MAPDPERKWGAEGWRGRREGGRGRADGGRAQVQKVRGCVRKANEGDTFANDLGKLSPSVAMSDTSRKVRTRGSECYGRRSLSLSLSDTVTIATVVDVVRELNICPNNEAVIPIEANRFRVLNTLRVY